MVFYQCGRVNVCISKIPHTQNLIAIIGMFASGLFLSMFYPAPAFNQSGCKLRGVVAEGCQASWRMDRCPAPSPHQHATGPGRWGGWPASSPLPSGCFSDHRHLLVVLEDKGASLAWWPISLEPLPLLLKESTGNSQREASKWVSEGVGSQVALLHCPGLLDAELTQATGERGDHPTLTWEWAGAVTGGHAQI